MNFSNHCRCGYGHKISRQEKLVISDILRMLSQALPVKIGHSYIETVVTIDGGRHYSFVYENFCLLNYIDKKLINTPSITSTSLDRFITDVIKLYYRCDKTKLHNFIIHLFVSGTVAMCLIQRITKYHPSIPMRLYVIVLSCHQTGERD